jgi:hypothetical protein
LGLENTVLQLALAKSRSKSNGFQHLAVDQLRMTLDQARTASHSGSCDDDVKWLSQRPHIANQLDAIDPALLADELREYGAWDETELADHDQNLQRLVWIAAGDIVDNA